MNLLKRLIGILGSFGFAVVMILLMFLLTFLGTLEQVDLGLYYVQQKYFESLFLTYDLFGFPIPLPGGFLVMSLFAVNLIVGGLIRIRKKRATVGVIIAHSGILLMLLGGLVTFKWADNGHMTLYENESSNEFVSYTEWNIELFNPDGDTMHVIPEEQFADLQPGESRTFYSDDLPFDVTLTGFAENAEPLPVGPVIADKVRAVDGYFLQTLEREKEAARNVPGAYATFKDKATGEEKDAILWGLAAYPAVVDVGGTTWAADFARKRWQVPFTIVLDEFTHEYHPGTGMASNYESLVTKIEGDSAEQIRIYMNAPLRYEGYTFFQESWGPSDWTEGDPRPLFSQLAVWRNPSDHWPLYACIIISAGLLFHFLQKLGKYIRAENKKRQLAT